MAHIGTLLGNAFGSKSAPAVPTPETAPAPLPVPTLQPIVEAPSQNSQAIRTDVTQQLAALGGRGRDSTILSKRKKPKADSLLDDSGTKGSDAAAPAPYSGTTLG